MKERIQKVLGNAGIGSRRGIEEMVRQGRVAVNGRVMTELPILIDPAKDRVTVDDEELKLGRDKDTSRRYYLIMNKPKGVYSTNVAQGDQVRAIDLLPEDFPARVYPVGRLDAESKGLLLLTNDGDLTNRLTHPRYGVPKTYRAIVDGWVTPESIASLEKGVWLADPRAGKGVKASVSHIKVFKRSREKSIIDITLHEGRNRQIRRMLAKIGHKVRDLTRVKMGPLTLKGLDTGHFRELTATELKHLRQYTDRAEQRQFNKSRGAAKDERESADDE